MSKYNKDTKFYWLQLKEDFFENDAIEWLEDQKPNGRDYAYFYLKLCLKSLKTNGILIRKVGNILIPYDNQKLSELTKIDFDTVTVAMELLQKIGLITILEGGEIYISQLEKLIGSKSVGAFKKQQQRSLTEQGVDKCLPAVHQVSANCPPKIEIELEKELEKELDNNIYIPLPKAETSSSDVAKASKHKYGEYKHVLLKDEELQALKRDYANWEELIKYLDEYIEMKGYKAKSHYLCIRKWVVNAVNTHKRDITIKTNDKWERFLAKGED